MSEGTAHALPPRDLGRLVAVADLTGGQIRNAVLTAVVLAREETRPIELRDVVRALHDEYRGRALLQPVPGGAIAALLHEAEDLALQVRQRAHVFTTLAIRSYSSHAERNDGGAGSRSLPWLHIA